MTANLKVSRPTVSQHCRGKRGLSVLEARADGFPGVGGVALCHTREVCHGFEANTHKLYTVG